ncbi:MAG: ABC transporter ATP-binding protein [Eubacteriaceae bacterium]
MIEYKNIYVEFNNNIIFNNFNLFINKNEKILLNAPSGKGKSTLIKMLLGLHPNYTGDIYFEGNMVDSKNINIVRTKISYVSQDVDLPKGNVEELIQNIYKYKKNRHLNYNESRVVDILKEFEMDETILDKNIIELSGGERQRLGFIIAILLERQIWIMDEVTSGLDKKLKNYIMNYIIKQNKTVIIISHDDCWLNQNVRVVNW